MDAGDALDIVNQTFHRGTGGDTSKGDTAVLGGYIDIPGERRNPPECRAYPDNKHCILHIIHPAARAEGPVRDPIFIARQLSTSAPDQFLDLA
jgi:hypothetical protein